MEMNLSNANYILRRLLTQRWHFLTAEAFIRMQELTSHPSELWKEPATPVFNTEMDFGNIITSKDRIGLIGMASNYLDHTPTSHLNKITSTHQYNDLASMLTSIGLEKYIRECTSTNR